MEEDLHLPKPAKSRIAGSMIFHSVDLGVGHSPISDQSKIAASIMIQKLGLGVGYSLTADQAFESISTSLRVLIGKVTCSGLRELVPTLRAFLREDCKDPLPSPFLARNIELIGRELMKLEETLLRTRTLIHDVKKEQITDIYWGNFLREFEFAEQTLDRLATLTSHWKLDQNKGIDIMIQVIDFLLAPPFLEINAILYNLNNFYLEVKRLGLELEFLHKAYEMSTLDNSESDDEKSDDEKFDIPGYMMSCFLFCSLLPENYEFDKDKLVQLWIAEGFIQPQKMKQMEDIGCTYFDIFLSKSWLQYSRLDYASGQPKYRLHNSVLAISQKISADEYGRIEDVESISSNISGSTVHSSLFCDSIDPTIFENFYHAKKLRTLLLLREYGAHIKQVPLNLFLKLRFLRVLDLSQTHITKLPSCIQNLKDLRYIDLSGTPIKRLPESLCSLDNMQTLKLIDCLELVGLPKDMRNLINLRHLYLDIVRQLISMPPGIGNLTSLRTLPAFIVGIESGCHIVELKDMKNLHGTLRIVQLENVSNLKECKEAALNDKEYLHKLELRWTKVQYGIDILEGLQPHRNLKELQIVGYGSTKFPSWLGDPSFSNLVNIYLYNCTNCELLPPLGKLPFLKSFYIGEMHAVKTIDRQFCGEDKVKGFPRLETLGFDGMPNLEKWTGIEEGDLSCLQKLTIACCPKLIALPMLSCLKSLQHLEITLCSELVSLSEEGLNTSIQSLHIRDCPILKERCQKEEGEYWCKIAHIPIVWIDYQQIL